jgi:Lrp/AsnC family transcriptional regulator, leucine-responsive regulatory protein
MDKTDICLIMLLSENSRLSYAELAEKLNLSVNAIHKRIQLLIQNGIIRKFTAKVSLYAAKATLVTLSGVSQLASFHELPDKLKAQGSIYWLAIGSGKFLYIGTYLKSLNELEPLVNYLKKEAGLLEPTVGIMPLMSVALKPGQKLTEPAICDLDYKIIHSLKDNSRKPISDVADELGISAKTARRRLNLLIKNFLVDLSIEWYPDKSNDLITLIDIHLKPQANINEAYTILRKYAPNTLFYFSFVNIPNFLTYAVWTNSMLELQNIREKLEKEENVSSVTPNILLIGYIFDTWRDQLTEKT